MEIFVQLLSRCYFWDNYILLIYLLWWHIHLLVLSVHARATQISSFIFNFSWSIKCVIYYPCYDFDTCRFILIFLQFALCF